MLNLSISLVGAAIILLVFIIVALLWMFVANHFHSRNSARLYGYPHSTYTPDDEAYDDGIYGDGRIFGWNMNYSQGTLDDDNENVMYDLEDDD